MIRVVVSAHVRLYREGLAEILTRAGDVQIVAGARSIDESLSFVHELEPDLVLVDATEPGSLDAVRQLVASGDCKVIALASSGEEHEVIAYAEAGVSGFVSYEDSPDELISTIRSVASGELLCSPGIAATLLRRVAALAAERTPPNDSRLTARELEVIRLIDEGLSNKQIAARLMIELPTVKHHVHHILEKLAARRRTEAVARARTEGLLQPRRA
jgi:two-component system nitrate/nitrite response regulator NarL